MKFEIVVWHNLLCNWESLACDIRPDCHHYLDASGTSDMMHDELAKGL